MKIFNQSEYPNLFDHISLTSSEVENIIENFILEFPSVRNQKAEWEISFPMFLTPFYKYVYKIGLVLEQNKFYDYYLDENKEFFAINKFSDDVLLGLKARIFRTYPSLVRDLHFNLMVKENIKDALIIYNRKLDVEEGIDLLIEYKNKFYAINLFTDTKRAHVGRAKKVFRHTPFDNVEYIELPVNFKGSVKCGNFFLYGNTELSQITKLIY